MVYKQNSGARRSHDEGTYKNIYFWSGITFARARPNLNSIFLKNCPKRSILILNKNDYNEKTSFRFRFKREFIVIFSDDESFLKNRQYILDC